MENQTSDSATFAFNIYYNYVLAFKSEMGKIDSLLQRQRCLKEFRELKGKTAELDKKALIRGWLMIKTMRELPVAVYPDLAQSAIFIAPVMSYYALHGIGISLLSITGIPPRRHATFLSSMSDLVKNKRLMPYPFNIWCNGLSRESDYTRYDDSSVNVKELRSLKPQTKPQTHEDMEKYIRKALLTTRDDNLDDKFNEFKKREMIGRLSTDRKREIERGVSPTTVFDFIYRMRRKTNYKDPSMYHPGEHDEIVAKSHYENLFMITRGLAKLLDNIIKKRIGTQQYKQLLKEIKIK